MKIVSANSPATLSYGDIKVSIYKNYKKFHSKMSFKLINVL